VQALYLTDEDARELSSALEMHLVALRTELAAAEARQFRASLRDRLDRLEQVAERIRSLAAVEPVEQPGTD